MYLLSRWVGGASDSGLATLVILCMQLSSSFSWGDGFLSFEYDTPTSLTPPSYTLTLNSNPHPGPWTLNLETFNPQLENSSLSLCWPAVCISKKLCCIHHSIPPTYPSNISVLRAAKGGSLRGSHLESNHHALITIMLIEQHSFLGICEKPFFITSATPFSVQGNELAQSVGLRSRSFANYSRVRPPFSLTCDLRIISTLRFIF